MKKLMTMIAAVATAFGLFAAVPSITDNAVDFSEFTNMNPWDLTDKDGQADALWTWSDTAPATDEAKIEDGELVLKTGAKILARKFAGSAVTVDDDLGLFANVKLDFQNQGIDVDSIPTATDLNGAKLALFLLDTSDVEGSAVAEGGTNLFAIAGCGATRALYQLSATVDDAFLAQEHSFTIKFYNQALSDSNRAGFMIYMDGENAGAGEGVALKALYRYDLDGDVFDLTERTSCMDGNYLGDLTVNPSLTKWYNEQRLLISLVQNDNQTFTGVEFKGNASIASIKLTDDKDEFEFIPGDAKAIGVDDTALATKLAASNFVFDPTTGASFANGVITVFDDATQITVTPTFSLDKEIHEITIGSEKGTDSLTFTINDGTILTVREAVAAAYVTVDGVKTPYETFAEAFDAACDNDGATLALNKNLTIEEIGADYLDISISGSMILDLAGKTITAAGNGVGVITVEAGALTITNSVPADGGVVATEANGIAVNNVSGDATVTIVGGKFDGLVQNFYEEEAPDPMTYTGIEASAGSFTVDPTGKFLAAGKIATYDGEKYYVVGDEPVNYVASVTANGTEMGPFETVEEALAAVQAAEQAGTYPIVVTALADDGLEITDQNRTAKIAKDVTITITQPEFWNVGGVLGYAGAIDGTVTANDIEKIDGADITLGLGAFVSVPPTSEIDASFFTSGEEGYEVQLTDTHGGLNSFALVKVWTVTVTLGEGITAVATNATQGGAAKFFEESGTFKVNNNDVIGIEYACAVPGYEPDLEGEIQAITENTEFKAEKQAITYTITYMYKDAELTGLTPTTYTVEAAATLPTEVELLDGASFEAWYDNAELEGDPVTEIALGSTDNKTFYAKASKVVDPVAEIIEDKVDGFDQLEKEQQQAAYDNVQALYGQFESVPAAELWIEAVYGSTGAKIPAEKLAASTEELVSISVKYDLPILTTAVEAQVVAATADGFNFKLVDGEDVNVAMAAVKEMIEYSADLSTFAVNKDEVGAEVDEDGVTIKATFLKPADEAKGFMKLHLTADDE